MKTIKRYKHTFTIKQEGESFVVWLKKVGETKRMLSDHGSEVNAQAFVKEYCKVHKIPFVKPTERDASKAGNADQWRKAADTIAKALSGDHAAWLEALGLSEMPASLDTLKRAYRKASMTAHPDRGGSDEAQHRVTEAYNSLKDII